MTVQFTKLLLADISALASRSHIFFFLGTKSIPSGNTVLVMMFYFILFYSLSVWACLKVHY